MPERILLKVPKRMPTDSGKIWSHHHDGECHHSGPPLGLGVITEVTTKTGKKTYKLLCRSCKADLAPLFQNHILELHAALAELEKTKKAARKRKPVAVAAVAA